MASNLILPDFGRRFNTDWADLDAADKVAPSVKKRLENANVPDEQKKAFNQFLSFSSHFLSDPAAALAQIGAQVGPERRIRALYRVRAYFHEAELAWNYGQWDLATFGYPIFLVEDSDPI
jgi:hypothetical protein